MSSRNTTKGWKRPFHDLIPLPRVCQRVTLKDAAKYIQKLPKAKQHLEEWQNAVEALILVAEHGGPIDACWASRPRPDLPRRL
jgi:hypothetical protein